jgi:Beta-propeller repeat
VQRKLISDALLCVTLFATMAAHYHRAPAPSAQAAAYGALPLSFEPNVGQTAAGVDFLAHGSGYTLALTAGTAALGLRRGTTAPTNAAPSAAVAAGLQLQLGLVGANPQAPGSGEAPLPGTVNYFLGNDSAAWRTGISTYARVRYREVYPGVDVVYYGEQGQLEYDFELAPGANPTQVRLDFARSTGVAVDGQGGLLVQLAGGAVRQERPQLYQEVDGERRAVGGTYLLEARGQVGIAVGAYDASRALVIDPVLVYATYLGGSSGGVLGGDVGRGVAVDGAGNAYVTGFTASADFPTQAPLQAGLGGSGATNAFAAKLNPAGNALVYATYLGGSGGVFGDEGKGIAVDGAGNAYVTVNTRSADFPTTAGAFQTSLGSVHGNAFVAELNPAGNALVYSTYLGGSGNSRQGNGDAGSGIAVDGAGNAYVTGFTDSADFPTQAPLQAGLGGSGATNAFVAELNPAGSALVYSTYLGGSGGVFVDEGTGIAVDGAGNAYVTGNTRSADFPTTVGAFQTSLGNEIGNAFVAKLNPAGSALVYSTYLGGSGNSRQGNGDAGAGIAVDGAGNAYVTGHTGSPDFPTKNPLQAALGGQVLDNAFVAKLNAAGSALVYSTYLGGSRQDVGRGIAVDGAGNAYVTGDTGSPDFPTQAPLQAALGSVHIINNGNAFVAKLNAAGSAFVYSTYVGGGGDAGRGIAVDGAGNAYVTGTTDSADFPTKNPLQGALGGSGATNTFVAKIAGDGATSSASGLQPGPGTGRPAAAPVAPSALTATVQDASSLQLAWTLPADADGAIIDDASGHAVATTSRGQTSYTVQGLTPGSYVCFIAYAFNAAGSSGWSNWACATLLPASSFASGITAGPDGNLWFTEPHGNRIGRITPAGEVTEYSDGISANSHPVGITAGPDGNLWFTEPNGNRIGRITPAGVVTEFSRGITSNSAPYGITAGPDGNLWFTERNGNRIGRITPAGAVTEFSIGITPNSTPYDIAAGPDGNLWFLER